MAERFMATSVLKDAYRANTCTLEGEMSGLRGKGLKIFIGLDGDTLLVIVGASLVLYRLLLSRPTFTPVLLFVHKDKSFLANKQTQSTTVRSTWNAYSSGRSGKAIVRLG